MMLTSPFYPQNQFHSHMHPYSPPRPSPLSERSANVVPQPFSFNFSMASQNEKKPLVPQRAYKPNPVMQNASASRDAQAQRRRDMFFRRVQKDRDDKKWETRGDQIQRLDFMSEQKRWQAEKAREAPREDDVIEDDILEDATLSYESHSNSQPEQEMDEAENILAQEEYELQQLIELMEAEQDTASQHYGSDDEDYDQIFMECATTTTHDSQQRDFPQSSFDDADAMDIS